jgi:hypothetical protein
MQYAAQQGYPANLGDLSAPPVGHETLSDRLHYLADRLQCDLDNLDCTIARILGGPSGQTGGAKLANALADAAAPSPPLPFTADRLAKEVERLAQMAERLSEVA